MKNHDAGYLLIPGMVSRKRINETGVEFDNLSYTYQPSPRTNRLLSIDDSYTTTATHPNDIEDQGAKNYAYDQIGNLTSDTQEGLSLVVWTPSNKIDSIATSAWRIGYSYDAMGNRIRKRVWNTSNELQSTTWYVRDPQGSPLAIYTKNTTEDIKLREVPLYGSDRIGMIKPDIALNMTPFDTVGIETALETHRFAAQRFYELKDHLGNIRAVVNDDVQLLSTGEYIPTVVSMTDYYPFGMAIEERTEQQSSYRYGFNGKENDNEVKGAGNQQDYGFRIYDPRVGRFLSVDPLTREYPWYTPYQFAGNTPIQAIDRQGKDAFLVIWFAKSDDGSIGHTALVVENYKTITKKVVENGRTVTMTEKVPDGTYQYFDLWPEKPVDKTELQTGVKSDYNTKVLFSLEDFTLNDPSVSGERGKVSELGEGRAPDAVVRFTLDAASTESIEAKGNMLVEGNNQYNASFNNCTTFAIKTLNVAVPSLNGEEYLDAPWFMEMIGLKDTMAKTPNQAYRDATKIPGSSIEKKPKVEPEKKNYLDIVK
ncbi:MAG: hypothetical protein HYX66_10300 [Ignavibacteria bacterium]|nr:hypothetical protein [Ignavibacteria bacterium]